MTSIERYDESRATAPHPAVRHVTERDIALIERQAAILAKSSVVPLTNAADVAMIGMKALALGVDPMAAFDDIYAIPSDGKTRLTISARMRVALARRAGCEVWFQETTDQRATCCLRRPGQRRVHTLTYTIQQARTAGLATKNNWKNHPAAMLRAAAARQLVNLAAQDVLLGIGGMGDVDLNPDIDDLDLPEETVDHSAPLEGEGQQTVLASDEDRQRLLARIDTLASGPVEWLRHQAKVADIPPIRHRDLQASHVTMWNDLIDAAEHVVDEEEPAPAEVHDDAPEAGGFEYDDNEGRPF